MSLAGSPPSGGAPSNGAPSEGERDAVEQDVHALPRVDPAHITNRDGVVWQPQGLPGAARTTGEELGRVGLLVHDEEVGTVELRRHRLRNSQDEPGKVEGQETLDGQRGARLDNDLPGVPYVRRAREPGRGPPVPAVQRVAVHHVGPKRAGETPERQHALRPTHGVRQPGRQPVAGANAVHRHHVEGGPGGGELSRYRRGGREGYMDGPTGRR